MNQIKHLEPRPGVKLIAVKVPEGCVNNRKGINRNGTKLYLWNGKGVVIDLPEGNWTILGLSTELTEEQWSELFIKGGNESFGELYKVNNLFYAKASKAGVAFLSSEGVEPNSLILKAI